MGLDGLRERAEQQRREQYTALHHHLTAELLTESFYKLRRKLHQPVADVGHWLKRVVQGYFNYHAVPDNLRRLQSFRDEVCRAWLQVLRRRSQRHRMTWVRYKYLIAKYVPRCRVQHPYPPQRHRVIT